MFVSSLILESNFYKLKLKLIQTVSLFPVAFHNLVMVHYSPASTSFCQIIQHTMAIVATVSEQKRERRLKVDLVC
jgi:hypothetical protein